LFLIPNERRWTVAAEGSEVGQKPRTSNLSSHVFGILTTPELLAGLTCYGLGAIAYILLLTRVNLALQVLPSLVYVFSVLLG